ncbi:MAG: MBL fold metallo-hydrolase [Theionarchaea archaeon]|nr:MBL fold metallo-hydrolase [Theionarchaea archaeon]MBU7037661.1 MBL fold metallo-hydrolase [Theionarchaea archaeon]
MIHQLMSFTMASNVFILEDDITVMVDAGMGLSRRVTDYVEEKGLTIDVLVNTHCHVDHTGGNGLFPHAKIYAHELDAPDIEAGSQKTLWHFGFERPFKFPVSKVLKEGDIINTGNHNLSVIHTPGHTEGSMSLYEEDTGVLFSGDCVFDMGIGRMDFPTGNAEDMKKSLKRLLTLDIETIYAGHGGIGTKDSIRTGLEFFF